MMKRNPANTGSRSRPAQRKRSRYSPLFWLIVIVFALVAVLLVSRLFVNRGTTNITVNTLNCFADERVTPFGDNVLYYRGDSLCCDSVTGKNLWKQNIGYNASFSVSDTHIAVWHGTTLTVFDKDGRSVYSDNQTGTVQFVRISGKYVAVCTGNTVSPMLTVQDLDGNQLDSYNSFTNMMLLDCGFYNDGYIWTLALDLYSTTLNSRLAVFHLGGTNSENSSAGVTDLGDKVVYRVLWENGNLRVFSTQQLYTFDYRGVQNVNRTMLVHGWTLIDAYIPPRGNAVMLLQQSNQRDSGGEITELRVMSGDIDLRYSLPLGCIGAAVRGKNVYGFSDDFIYRANISSQRFQPYANPLADDGAEVSAYFGTTNNGYAILAQGSSVYALKLPEN